MSRTRKLTIIAQDPSVKNVHRKILRTKVDIPYEELGPGPRGYRVHVVDYDAAQKILYKPADLTENGDTFARSSDRRLLSDPAFHAQNVYAIVMRLLSRFEAALGRRVSWGFDGHQIHVVPHAFADMNAYYSDDSHSLFFGYFPDEENKPVFTALSHDIIAHEATHALLDGLRNTYTVPSGPDQAAFHEALADVVALLSVFGLRDVVKALLSKKAAGVNKIFVRELRPKRLVRTALFGLAEQFGQEASRHRDACLRNSVKAPPRKDAYRKFTECHLRGEILVAAVLNAFIAVWERRLKSWLPRGGKVSLDRVVEDGSDAAEHLLTMCIRAIDYCPVVNITFGDFLSALLTADYELLPDDGKYLYRKALRKEFARWKIVPSSKPQTGKPLNEPGLWEEAYGLPLDYDCVHHEFLERDLDEVFRFLWENRKVLRIHEEAYTSVISVRPCVRVGPDGFVLKETVSEYRQSADVEADRLASVVPGLKKPKGMKGDAPVRLYGGGVLIFNEFGKLKYHIGSNIANVERQNERMQFLWDNGIRDSKGRYGFSDGSPAGQRFAVMHARRDGRSERIEEMYGQDED